MGQKSGGLGPENKKEKNTPKNPKNRAPGGSKKGVGNPDTFPLPPHPYPPKNSKKGGGNGAGTGSCGDRAKSVGGGIVKRGQLPQNTPLPPQTLGRNIYRTSHSFFGAEAGVLGLRIAPDTALLLSCYIVGLLSQSSLARRLIS